MNWVLDHPLVILIIAFVLQWLVATLGDIVGKRRGQADRGADFVTVLPAALTLLGLIIGFSFSMAVSRYDQRRNLEEAEANAIGTEYVRIDFLPAAPAAQTRELLRKYVEQRVLFYTTKDPGRLKQINEETLLVQNSLWSTIVGPVTAQPTQVAALVASGMNDVLNSQGYTQAAWLNRIPVGAWLLMIVIALAGNLLLGYSERHGSRAALLVLPLLVSLALFLIADIDSPRTGVIPVPPQNLLLLYETMK